MSQRTGFKNIQIQAKPDLYELFSDTYEQSGLNSKAEFLSALLYNYLNPEETDTSAQRKAEENLQKASEEKEELSARLAMYETDELKAVLKKHKGEKLVFNNSKGEKMSIEINDLPDVFSAIFNSVKIS